MIVFSQNRLALNAFLTVEVNTSQDENAPLHPHVFQTYIISQMQLNSNCPTFTLRISVPNIFSKCELFTVYGDSVLLQFQSAIQIRLSLVRLSGSTCYHSFHSTVTERGINRHCKNLHIAKRHSQYLTNLPINNSYNQIIYKIDTRS